MIVTNWDMVNSWGTRNFVLSNSMKIIDGSFSIIVFHAMFFSYQELVNLSLCDIVQRSLEFLKREGKEPVGMIKWDGQRGTYYLEIYYEFPPLLLSALLKMKMSFLQRWELIEFITKTFSLFKCSIVDVRCGGGHSSPIDELRQKTNVRESSTENENLDDDVSLKNEIILKIKVCLIWRHVQWRKEKRRKRVCWRHLIRLRRPSRTNCARNDGKESKRKLLVLRGMCWWWLVRRKKRRGKTCGGDFFSMALFVLFHLPMNQF